MIKINKIMFRDKRAVKISNAFFALMFASMAIIAVGVILNGWNDFYGSGLDPDLDEFSRLSELQDEAEDQQGSISVKSTTSGEEFEGTSIRAVFGIINGLYDSFRIVFGDEGIIDAAAQRFGLPQYVHGGIITLMIMAITFAIIVILFKIPGGKA